MVIYTYSQLAHCPRAQKKFKVPINIIKLSDVLLRRTFSLEYIFELKELKIGVAQACCPDLFV